MIIMKWGSGTKPEVISDIEKLAKHISKLIDSLFSCR